MNEHSAQQREQNERDTAALVDYLERDGALVGWREQLNGWWTVFLCYGDRSYVLLPLHDGER